MNIIEAEVCVDHVHMLVEIPPKMSVSGFVGSHWCRGFYVDTVGKNLKAIGEYMRN